jgi:hypothetical protein
MRQRIAIAVTLDVCAVFLLPCLPVTAGSTGEEIRIPDRPVLNDLKCIALSPYYIPRNIAASWWGIQRENLTFFDESTRLSSGRPPSAAEKVGFATVAVPLSAVVSVPACTIGSGVVPFCGHLADLCTAPFGMPLRFHRLDGSSFGG